MKKYLLCMFVLILMLLGISAYADGIESGLTWSLSDGVLTIFGNGAIPDYSNTSPAPWREAEIHSVIIENGVTRVGAWAFDHCSAESISLPETLTSIGDYSFRCNNSLQNIDIPYGVTEIGTWAFEQCQALESISFPDTLVSIGQSTFYKCAKLQSVVIPASVAILRNNLFYECWRLRSVTFSSNVTAVEENAFAYCSWLDEVFFIGSAADWDGITIGEGNANLTNALRHYVYNENLSWTLVDGVLTIKGTGLMPSFSDDAPWAGTGFTSAVIEEGISSVSSRAFRNCIGMQTISLPDSLIKIDTLAFQSCSALTVATLPDSVSILGTSVFSGCSSLSQVTFGAGLSSIGDTLFNGCSSLTTIECSTDNVNYKAVDGVLFNKNQTKLVLFPVGREGSYTIPAGITTVGQSAFYRATKLTEITIPEGVTTINMMGFSGCSGVTIMTLPASLRSMDMFAFGECSGLKRFIIREGLQNIPSGAFAGCRNLESVYLPVSIRSIGSSAFDSSCSSLSIVYYTGSEADWGNVNVGSDNAKLTSAQIYYNHVPIRTGTVGTLTYTITDEGVLTVSGNGAIPNDAFIQNNNIANPQIDSDSILSVVIEEGITSIGDWAFGYCMNMTDITIPNTVTVIGESAFEQCHSLASIEFPDSVTSIGPWALSKCYALTSVQLPSGIETLPARLFPYDSSLTSIVIPASVINFGNGKVSNFSSTFYESSTTIYCYRNSAAHTYAVTYEIPYVLLDEEQGDEELGVPTNIHWVEESTATATWDAVENATYYLVDVKVTLDNELIGETQTGTADTAIDVQQEIHDILEAVQREGEVYVMVCFAVTAQCEDGESVNQGEKSGYSEELFFRLREDVIVAPDAPSNLVLSDELEITSFDFSYDGPFTSYVHQYRVRIVTNDSTEYYIEGNDEYGFSIHSHVEQFCQNNSLAGQTVTVDVAMAVECRLQTGDLPSEFDPYNTEWSEYSNSVMYTAESSGGETIITPDAPSNLVLSDELEITSFGFSYDGPFTSYVHQYRVRIVTSDSMEHFIEGNDEYGFSIHSHVEQFCQDNGLAGQTVTVDVAMAVECRLQTGDLPSEFDPYNTEWSEYSNSVMYTAESSGGETIITPDAPSNLVLSNELEITSFDFNYDGPFTSYLHQYEIRILTTEGIEYEITGNDEYGFSVLSHVLDFYQNNGLLGKTITVDVRMAVECRLQTGDLPSEFDPYNTEWSMYSNAVEYGERQVQAITLSPRHAILFARNSLALGKTIEPLDAYYIDIDWFTDDPGVLRIDNTGTISGLALGTANVTARIDRAVDTIPVTVYTISSNIGDEDDQQQAINMAGDIIDDIANNDDPDLSHTDIIGENIETIKDEIIDIVSNGGNVNVDIKTEVKPKSSAMTWYDIIQRVYNVDDVDSFLNVTFDMYVKDKGGDDHHIGNITDFYQPMTVSVAASGDTSEPAGGYTRTYEVFRVHDDGNGEQVESLGEPAYDGESFIFRSDKFSDFIIAYTDTRDKIDLSQYNVLYLPAGLKTVGSEAFSGVAAQVIVIPEQCEAVIDDAFRGCEQLTYIVNYSSVTIVPPEGVEVLTEGDVH